MPKENKTFPLGDFNVILSNFKYLSSNWWVFGPAISSLHSSPYTTAY